MRIIRHIALATLLTWGWAGPAAVAQQGPPPHAPQIHAAMNSTDELSADIKYLCELAGPPGVKGWKLLEPFLVTTFEGTDPKKPIIVDVLIIPSGTEVRAHFPLQVPAPGKVVGAKFVVNVTGIVGNSKKLKVGFYELGGAFKGFMRMLGPPIYYASIATDQNLVPANLPDPTRGKVVTALLAKKFDIGLLMKNDKQAAADQQARRTDFQKVRDNLIAGLKQALESTPEEFAVQKALLEHGLNELDRFVAESDELALGWTTDAQKNEARLDFELSAIPGTALETSAKLLGQNPGMFASVPRRPDAILSGRLNFPLDQLRQSGLSAAMPLFRASGNVQIDASKTKSAEQKAATKQVSNLWFDMVDAEVKEGVIDAMIDVSQAPGQPLNLLFGIKAKDGNALKGILELLPKINADFKVQLDVEKVGDYSIHSIQIPEKEQEDFELFFGKGAPFFVVTGPKAWWVAIGAKSLDQFKVTLGSVGKENAEAKNNFLTLFYHVAPWIEFLDARRMRIDAVPSEKKLTEVELNNKKERAAHRKLALDTLKAGKDTIETKLDAKGGRVTGSTRFDEGLLRLIGSETADFSNKTLK